jgi:hypothetical protein
MVIDAAPAPSKALNVGYQKTKLTDDNMRTKYALSFKRDMRMTAEH